ncbi:MAG: hypothetical protein Q4Q17_02500 [Tissierellia bacterium]|nr:hypothetical protein [Tissierellia bacterium]
MNKNIKQTKIGTNAIVKESCQVIPESLKQLAKKKRIELTCYYAGCGVADSWPLSN